MPAKTKCEEFYGIREDLADFELIEGKVKIIEEKDRFCHELRELAHDIAIKKEIL